MGNVRVSLSNLLSVCYERKANINTDLHTTKSDYESHDNSVETMCAYHLSSAQAAKLRLPLLAK